MPKTIHVCSKCGGKGNWVFSGKRELTHIPCGAKFTFDEWTKLEEVEKNEVEE